MYVCARNRVVSSSIIIILFTIHPTFYYTEREITLIVLKPSISRLKVYLHPFLFPFV